MNKLSMVQNKMDIEVNSLVHLFRTFRILQYNIA